MVRLLGAYQVPLMIMTLTTVGTVVLAMAAPKVLGQAISVTFEGVTSTTLPADTTGAQTTEALWA